MEILMVAAELTPYAGASEAANSVAALSRTLVQLGHDVTIALPRYRSFEEQGLLVARRLTPLQLPSGQEVTVFDGQLASGVKISLFDSPDHFEREGVYGEGKKDYADNAARFALLGHAAAALAVQRSEQGQAFEVVHGHDWPGALALLAIGQTELALPKVLTVHDASRSGSFALKELKTLGIDEALNTEEGVRAGARINVLKGGIQAADTVAIASPAYARDLADPEFGGPLAASVAARGEEVQGILAGLDYAVYNPTVDTALPCRFNAENFANKGICKTHLLRSLDLAADVARPLVVALGPLTKERGMDLVAQAAPALLKQDATLIVAGGGLATIARSLAAKSLQKRDNYAYLEELDVSLERRLLAAADLVIAPARYEIAATSVRKAQRYGAAPVALARGAAADVVVDCDADVETGTGFLFDEPSVEALMGAVTRGLAACTGPWWPRLTRRLLRLDSSWESPARRYLRVYAKAAS